jgi:hypothetical protein
VLLACYGNVPPERAAQVMGMLFGVPVSAGWADKAAARVSAQLVRAGFDEAMIAALTAEDVLAADETPVNVLDRTARAPEEGKEDSDPEEKEGKAAAGAPHVLITRTPDGRLTLLQAIASPQGRHRGRPEPWNHVEATPGGPCPKLVFAPPEGDRASNTHVVEAASEAARHKLSSYSICAMACSRSWCDSGSCDDCSCASRGSSTSTRRGRAPGGGEHARRGRSCARPGRSCAGR